MKQIGTAAQTHHDAIGGLPTCGESWMDYPTFSGAVGNQAQGRGEGAPESAPDQKASWLYQLLPYVEQRGAWEGKPALPTQPELRGAYAISRAIPVYYCPSRRQPVADPKATINQRWQGVVIVGQNHQNWPIGKNDYAGAQLGWGDGERSRLLVFSKEFSSSAELTAAGFVGMGWQGVGAIVRARAYDNASWRAANPSAQQTRFKQLITFTRMIDGTSNTILAGEKRLALQTIGSNTGEDGEGYCAGWDHDVMRDTTRPPLPDNQASGQQRFGSSHPGGFNVAMCDASVKFINYNIDVGVLARMGWRADGGTFELEK
jgi:prepilin-type processing-associated H-X9-DG protein